MSRAEPLATAGAGRRRRLASTGAALVDQVLSSGSGLVVLVLVARTGSAATLGSVGLALIVNGFLLGCVRALVGEVVLIRSRRTGADRQAEAATAVFLALAAAALGSGVLLATGAVLQNETGRYLVIVAAALPFVFVQDVLRYVGYAANRVTDAVVIDGAWLVVQALISIGLLATGRATAMGLFSAWAIGAVAGALLGCFLGEHLPSRRGVRTWLAEDRRRMASFFTDYLFSTGLVQASFLVLGVVLSRSEFGTFRLGAVAVSPLANGMAGVRVLALARLADRRQGAASALRSASQFGAGFTLVGAAYAAVLAVLPESMGVALVGPTWRDARNVALITAVGEALRLGSFAATDFVKVFARGFALVRTRAVVSIFVVVGALAGGSTAGPVGAATGIATAAAIGTCLWWLAAISARRTAGTVEANDADGPSERLLGPADLGLGWRTADDALAPRPSPTSLADAPPLRILHVVARSHLRGAEKVALELCTELDALGHHDDIVAVGLAQDGAQIDELAPLVDDVGVGPRVLVSSSRQLRRYLAEHPVDVVLAHGGWALQVALGALIPRTGPDQPLLVWQRILGVPDEVWKRGRRLVWRSVATRIDAAVALTTELEDEVRRLGFKGAVWVIPNARRPERFLAVNRVDAQARMREAIGVGDHVALIGFVGHLVKQKRPERAVEVLARVRAAGVDAHLVVAGDGPLRRAVELAIAHHDVADHVTLLGFRADVEEVLGASDLLLMTSEAEGIPGVAIEAQMTGCPVVTFPLGGVEEVVTDGVTGAVVARFDTGLMAERVLELLGDRAQLDRLGLAARDRSPEFAASRIALTYSTQLVALRHGLVATTNEPA